MPKPISKTTVATYTAILFHAIGLIGILAFESDLIIRSTAYNLLLSFALLIWTQKEKNQAFFIFVIATGILGFAAELVGVNTGLIFGKYTYGDVLGIRWMGVPFIIGINWIIIVYCCGIATHTLITRVIGRLASAASVPPKAIKAITVITDGATIATFFDWVMEPVAIKLGFWKWGGDGMIPYYNYFSWFVFSMLLFGIFHACNFRKRNKFAVNLLLIQFAFFFILRFYLNQ